MHRNNRPYLLTLMLMAIGLRAVLGAPCCMTVPGVDGAASGHHHTAHAQAEHVAHEIGHGNDAAGSSEEGQPAADPSANPCCSACSPPLPSDPVEFTARTAPKALPEPTPVRALATRPPYPAYEATGPPALI